MELPPGAQIVAEDGEKVALRYNGENTSIDLHSATASFRTDKSAKRVNLTSGLLMCTAAPQKRPFLLETPHAVAEVMGTRFWLDVTPAQTTLAVQEGAVALRAEGERLDAGPGQPVVADRIRAEAPPARGRLDQDTARTNQSRARGCGRSIAGHGL